MELVKIDDDWRLGACKDDPVRAHIPLNFRVTNGREVYALENDDAIIQAVICVAYTDEIPTNEDDLKFTGDKIAVFYTVWSYEKGMGREIVNQVWNHLKATKPSVKRYVTLSPLTDMARNFHLKNGAKFISKHADCQNFEYV